MSTSRNKTDLPDFSDLLDVAPWLRSQTISPPPCRGQTLLPKTTTLMSPAGSLTPAPLSRTKDGKPRVSDLNLLGLRGGALQRPPTPLLNTPVAAKVMEGVNSQGESTTATGVSKVPCKGKPRHDRVSALQSTPALPREIAVWRDEQRQEIDDARVRVHDVYVNDARAAARASAFVPTQILDTNNAYIGQTTIGLKIRQQLEEKERQQERQKVRQELFKPVPRPTKQFPSVSPPLPKPRQPIIHQQTSHCNVEQLTEAELDEKRRQLLTKKTKGIKEAPDGKAKKTKKRKKCKNEVSEPVVELLKISKPVVKEISKPVVKELSKPTVQETGQSSFVPHIPAAPVTDKENGGGSYSKRKRRLFVNVPVGEFEDVSNADDEIAKGYAPSGIYADDVFAKGYSQSVANADDEITNGYAPRVANVDDEIANSYSSSLTSVGNQSNGHIYYGRRSIVYENEQNGSSTGAGKATSHTPRPHPPLIPRQTSQQTMCWNSDTAKRGLGFRSKQRREAEERFNTGSPWRESPQ